MQTNYVTNMASILGHFQQPLKELMELNAKTFQNISYISDLSKIEKPEEFFIKGMHVFVNNGHKALEYMQKSFSIVEENLLFLSKEVQSRTEEIRREMPQIQKIQRHILRKSPELKKILVKNIAAKNMAENIAAKNMAATKNSPTRKHAAITKKSK